MINPKADQNLESAWPEAARLLALWLDQGERIDLLMARASGLPPVERARCQQLVFAAVRHAGRIQAGLRGLVDRAPRFQVQAALHLIGGELIEAGGSAAEPGVAARIVHHAVERSKHLASGPEARLVNAVGRKLAGFLVALPRPPAEGTVADLAEYHSHPAWLIERWRRDLGIEGAQALLDWNQQTGRVWARWRAAGVALPPPWLRPTAWPDFYEIETGCWGEAEGLRKSGQLYIQDPATRLAVDLLAPAAGETWLDACAAPGGKSVLIADRAGSGRLVAADPDRSRLVPLEENLALIRGVDASAIALDLLNDPVAGLTAAGLPVQFDGVLIDAPCSNTGVMRHRVDVKWRLREADFHRHARQQLALLDAAASLVAPRGRLVYSTCSIDPEENQAVVIAFAGLHPEFAREAETLALPWVCGHDGAGVFCLRRRA
jgi:16S rRNA (cytosine967-C5)-methyltransferase